MGGKIADVLVQQELQCKVKAGDTAILNVTAMVLGDVGMGLFSEKFADPTFVEYLALNLPDKKYKMEQNGVRYLESLLQSYSPEKAAEMLSLWEEHEEGKTPEAQWVREMDKFECLLQAHEYEQRTYGEKNLDEFQGQVAKIHSREGKRLQSGLQITYTMHVHVGTIILSSKQSLNITVEKRY
ncbi:hypothetical protein N7474_004707 [Penicillium riverlandense]|uniref:uncharacterized protein n=1 Tax=Penicillium riverlandense TaxID=1903569 RepID=UPI002549A25E|nr:uncharacterized protein N7474_004707 [Penicillium riverlandense]KAJ5819116.1 hypothetical protein N7474_004707 [Penicillium riverlandense]